MILLQKEEETKQMAKDFREKLQQDEDRTGLPCPGHKNNTSCLNTHEVFHLH